MSYGVFVRGVYVEPLVHRNDGIELHKHKPVCFTVCSRITINLKRICFYNER